MTTIVLNTLARAVTQYDWAFQSLTPDYVGDATGLYALGGDTDAGLPISSTITTAKKLWGASLKQSLAQVYFAMSGPADGAVLQVHGADSSWSYEFLVRSSGVSRAVTGRGIRENYLAFGFQNLLGRDFAIDRIEVDDISSKNRRL